VGLFWIGGVSAETQNVPSMYRDVRLPTGHVFRVSAARSRVVREVPPAGRMPGTEDARAGLDRRGRPPGGYLTKRTAAA
jgi:hypothetical protein